VDGGIGTSPWVENGVRVVFKAPISHRVIIPFWQQRWFFLAELGFCGFATVTCLYLLIRLLMQSRAQLVVQRERSRIARDVHDDLTAWLARLVLLGERTQNDLPENSIARGQVHEMCENSRSLLNALNQTIWVINSKRDTLPDLVSYLCRYAESFFQPTTIRCRFDVEDDIPAMHCDVGVRRNLFLAIKESLNNVLRHSVASEVTLRIHRQGGELTVRVEDNGKGFTPEQADAHRNGLSNMRDRAEDAGGSCMITSRPGAGCCVEFRVPWYASHRRSLWSFFRWKNDPSKNLANHPAARSPLPATASRHEDKPHA
jgi:signal transduction histidine kinase